MSRRLALVDDSTPPPPRQRAEGPERQCTICGRRGTRWFERQGGDGWICVATRECWKRNRRGQASLRSAIRKVKAAK